MNFKCISTHAVITGATGFLGSALAASILHQGGKVVALSRNDCSGNRTKAAILEACKGFSYKISMSTLENLHVIDFDGEDLAPLSECDELLKDYNVWHCAAEMSYDNHNLDSSLRTNLITTSHLYQYFGASKACKRFYYVSTAYTAGFNSYKVSEDLHYSPQLINSYQTSKWAAEMSLSLSQLKTELPLTIFRPSIVIGHDKTGWRGTNNFGFYGFLAAFKISSNKMTTDCIEVDLHPETELNLIPINKVIDDAMILNNSDCKRKELEFVHTVTSSNLRMDELSSIISSIWCADIAFCEPKNRTSRRIGLMILPNKPFMLQHWDFEQKVLFEVSNGQFTPYNMTKDTLHHIVKIYSQEGLKSNPSPGNLQTAEEPNGFNFTKYLFSHYEVETKTAIQYKDNEISIGELKHLTHSFSGALQDIRVEENSRALLLLKDTPAFSFSFLGVMAIGAIPVPLSPKLSIDSLLFIANDSQCKTIILEPDTLTKHGSKLIKWCREHSVKVIIQDVYSHKPKLLASETLSMQVLLANGTDTFQYIFNSPQDISFWQYTSGTTGNPKGVLHNSIGMIENYRLFAKNTLNLSDGDIYYSVARMFFGYGLGNSLFFPMLGGATVVLDKEWPTPEVVINNLNRYKPSAFFCVPAIYAALIKKIHLLDNATIRNLKICFSAGSSLPTTLFERWSNLTGKVILDGIGATEVGHVFLCNSPEEHYAGITGKVVNGYQVKLIPTQQLTGTNKQSGVLCVKGPSISQGYWNNTRKTAQKFVDGWYHTGDLFEKSSDGFYRYLGREDDLYKINGRWVVPNKIETYVSKTIDKVREVLLVPYLNSEGLEKSCLFIAGNINDLNENELEQNIIRQLNGCFSSFEIPNRVKVLSAFPRNDNGKIVRKTLSELATQDDIALLHEVKIAVH